MRWVIIPIILVTIMQLPVGRATEYRPTASFDFDSFMADVVMDDSRGIAYVSARDRDSVLLLSLADLQVIDEIYVGDGPMRMDMDPVSDRLYVALESGHGVAVVSLGTRNLEGTWPLTGEAVDVVVGRPGRIFVSGHGIYAVNASDGSVVWWQNNIEGVVAISPDFKFLYNGGLSSLPATVDKWDVQTDSPVKLGSNRDANDLRDMALSPDGTHLYLAAQKSIEIDTATMNKTRGIGGFETTAIAATPDGQRLLSGSNAVFARDLITGDQLDAFWTQFGRPRAIRMDSMGARVLISQADPYRPQINRLLVFEWVYAKPPTIEVISPTRDSSDVHANTTVRIRITDPSGVNLTSIAMSVDGNGLAFEWNASDSIATSEISGLHEGWHLLKASASNLAGIGPRVVNWTFAVDQSAPWSSIERVTYVSRLWSIFIEARGFDNISTIQDIVLYFRKDGGPWQSREPGGTYVGETARRWWEIPVNETGGFGLYEFYTVATDSAGNQEPNSPEPDASIQATMPPKPPDPIADLMILTLLVALLGIVSAIIGMAFGLWRSQSAQTGIVDTPYSRREMKERQHAAASASFTAFAVPMHVASTVLSLLGIKVIAEAVAGRAIEWSEIFNALEQTGYLVVIVLSIAAQVCFAIVSAVAAFRFAARRWEFALIAAISGIIAIPFSFIVLGGIVGATGGVLAITGSVIAASRPAIQ